MRGSAPAPRTTLPRARRGNRRRLRAAGVVLSAALLLPAFSGSPAAGAGELPGSGALQRAFVAASAKYHVPPSVLLAVSYLQSRWNAHGGAPSVIGGYGPMHLTDATTALTAGAHRGDEAQDPRGDSARPLAGARSVRPELPVPVEVPARLRTLDRAAELSGLSAEALRQDPAANVQGGAALLAAA
ncbi:N-acetylmuramoyl-L-alanine amidase, partial [Streptomyces sp. NPDC001719]